MELISIKNKWVQALRCGSFFRAFIFSLVAYGLSVKLFSYCMSLMEKRNGHQINDWLLSSLPSVNLSPFIFFLTYSSLVLFFLSLLPHPRQFMRAAQAYTLLLLMRIVAIYLIPLEPPIGMITLVDPVTNFFMPNSHGAGVIVKDLFFSGHISAISLFFFAAPNEKIKKVFFIMGLLVAAMILLQHVHYTIDVLAAPVFAFFAYRIPYLFSKREKSFIPSFEDFKIAGGD